MGAQREKSVVLIAINDFLMGGAQKMVADILDGLDPDVYEPQLLILAEYPGKDSFRELVPARIPVHQLSITSPYDIRGWIDVMRFLNKLRPAVVISNLYLTNTIVRTAAAVVKIPVIVVEHNTYKDKNILQHAVDWMLSFVTYRIIAVSQGVAEYIHTRQHIARKKIVVIPNGIDVQSLQKEASLYTRESARHMLGIDTQELVLLHVGRLVAQKDPSLLLAGFATFAKTAQKSCRLLIVGDGPLMASLRSQAEELGIARSVLFAGACSPALYYKASDIFVSTSLIEGFGLVRAEALWHGLPVVTTVTGGTSELLQDGENGVLVHERTPEAVAKGVTRVLAMDLERVSAYAHESANRFTIQETVRAYERVIDESLSYGK